MSKNPISANMKKYYTGSYSSSELPDYQMLQAFYYSVSILAWSGGSLGHKIVKTENIKESMAAYLYLYLQAVEE